MSWCNSNSSSTDIYFQSLRMTRSRDHESDRLVILHDTAALEDAGGLGRQVEKFNAGSSEPEVLGGFLPRLVLVAAFFFMLLS